MIRDPYGSTLVWGGLLVNELSHGIEVIMKTVSLRRRY